LAPTFGKAHARLGQSLYFLKDYEGAVIAYEDAIHYEPDNPVTRTYLEKAKNKLQRYVEKQARASRGEEVSVLTAESSIQATVVNSVATDPNASAAVIHSMGYRGHSKAMMKAVGGALTSVHEDALQVADTLTDDEGDGDQDDPDFDEAIRVQQRANKYLSNKNYRYAIEEYTAALFLVPDDENLSPDLHLGRAHALNGSRRHESARIDAQLAIKIKPSPEAYSTLAKSLFYMKDFQGAIDTFSKCKEMLPDGESLSMFDRAYLQKSETAMAELMRSGGESSPQSSSSASSTIPKLKPPRFVPREEALSRAPNMPSMPKQWPQQTAKATKALQCGPERNVLFLSEALGIKLTRGPDGIVRVIDVSPDVPGSPIARKGSIEVGDIIREAGGVDIRRPITNIMWGDTVALIKMAPRPIVLVVAKELTELSIVDQRRQAAADAVSPTTAQSIIRGESKVDHGFYPSPSSGENSVKQQMEKVS
jgi:tetratricopeptide (TPR) repeat protein